MKKRWILLTCVGVLTIALIVACTIDRPAEVSVITLEPGRVEQTVSCMGVVETANLSAITLPVSCRFSRVNVKAGDRIRKGDVLAVVDKENTREMLMDDVARMTLAAMPEEIIATQDGTVMEVKAKVNQTFENTSPCIVLSPDEELQIRIAIREKDLRKLKNGMQVRVTGEGFDKASYPGRLVSIASAARNEESGTIVEGWITLESAEVDPSLRIGLTAKAAIVTAVTESGYIVPYEAVQSEDDGFYIYAVNNGIAHKHRIEVTAQVAQGMLVEDQTLGGMQIVRDATVIKNDGQKVTLRETMA